MRLTGLNSQGRPLQPLPKVHLQKSQVQLSSTLLHSFPSPGITSEECENIKLHYSERRHKHACIYHATTLKLPQHPVDKRVASGQLCELGNILQQKFLNAF